MLRVGRESAVERIVAAAALPAFVLALWTLIGYFGLKTYLQLQAPTASLPEITRTAPVCGVTTLEALRRINLAPTRTFGFDGATYGLHRGYADCTVTQAHGRFDRNRVAYCQFSAPGGLTVKKDEKTYVFAPGPTKPATVWFADGEPRCVSDSDLNISRRIARRRGG